MSTSGGGLLRAAALGSVAGAMLAVSTPGFAQQTLEERLEALQRQVQELQAEIARQKAEQARQAERVHQLTSAEYGGEGGKHEGGGPKVSFGGQYRINAYMADQDFPGAKPGPKDTQTAARLRVRQNIDLKFNEQIDTHLQLELRHTTGNVSVTNAGGGNPDARGSGTGSVGVRHAVINYHAGNGLDLSAGIVPISDRFNDTLFSSDWDYNPVAVTAAFDLGPGQARIGAAVLTDGPSELVNRDDITQYLADYAWNAGGARLNLGLYVVDGPSVPSFGGPAQHAGYLVNGGLGATMPLGNGWQFKGFILGGYADQSLNPSNFPANSASLKPDDATGVAVQGILTGPFGGGSLGLMVTYASGDNDGTGFIPVMSVAGTNGYWGYTGLMTVQGPTDTAIDNDAINISNNGYGLTSVQLKYAFPIANRLDGYLGVGWFGGTDAPGTRDSTVAIDGLAMLTYHFTRILALDFGIAAADMNDSNSPYFAGTTGAFASPAGTDRTKVAGFARLQAEF